ncbi:hypothetical protein UFOVP326_96 [uncultured Caudovirales phage]|uniref:Uncharacterized protein n=1 Tax=uncultured Caudovirales phage TaxID=2100421 RepID=A0A6J5LXM3_9CAUD|nr:hypothetical protein UFOVP326_96 [uncultured Caudovirales phage]
MSAVATVARGGGVAALALPAMSQDLAYRVAALVTADGITRPPPGPELRQEARRMLGAYAAAVERPGSPDEVESWLDALSERGPRKPPEGQSWDSFVLGVGDASGDLPAAVWGDEAMRAAVRAFTWWPTPAELDAILRPIGTRMAREVRALRDLAQEPPPPPPPEEPRITPEQARAVLEKHGVAQSVEGPLSRMDNAPLPVLTPRTRVSVGEHRAGLRASYEKMAASGNPKVAEQGRIALARMDAAAARARGED